MKQCFQCSELIDDDARSCRHCGRVQPNRRASGFTREAEAAKHSRRLERAHLPPWLQGLKDLAHLLKTDPAAGKAVEIFFGAAGFGITWFFLGVVHHRVGLFGLEGQAFLIVRLLLSLGTIYFGMQFGAIAIEQLAEALGEAVGHERDTRIKVAEAERKAESKR